MNSFAIISDSTCDLGKDLRDKYEIDYVPMNYVVDGKEYPAMLDWVSHSAKDFYDIMRNGTRITTTQVPREAYEERFTALLEEGKDILYISCSSALSGSINIATVVANELSEKYPERTICCVDSLISSLGQGYLAIRASELRAEGKSITEIADYIVANRLKVHQFGCPDDLNYLKRAGRVKASSAFVGNLFGVKPIIISDVKGQNYAMKKVKGAANARREVASLVKESVIDPENQVLFISHADNIKDAELLRDEIMALCPFKEVYFNYIAPIVGASVGPGTTIAYCVGKEVTIEGTV
ncbi:MAG: DegV family protein [Clostridia bacterium]|nr:DegV family protein [Clostridia bacterium]